MKKYELLKEDSIEYEGRTLYRIRALKELYDDFGDIKVGDLGGYVESEDNLSQEGNCWVYDNAKVMDNAKVTENAWVRDSARLLDNAVASGNAYIYDDACICESAIIKDCSMVYGHAIVSGEAVVYDSADVLGNAKVYENATVSGWASVYGNARVCGNAKVCGGAKVYGDAKVLENARVQGNAKVCGDYVLLGAMVADGNVKLGDVIEIYYNNFTYAQKADERDKYFASLNANKRCADTIDRLISENHDGQHFDYDKVVDSIIKEFGAERVAVILAIQIQEHGSWDGRYSNENKNWAKSVRLPEKRDLALYANGVQCVHLTAHPILIDKVVSEVREYLSKSEHDTSNKKTPKTNDLCEH